MSPIALGLRGLGVGPSRDYAKLLLNMPGVFAFWPQWETEGSVIHCLTDPAMNGVYTGVNLADNWGPFGWKAPLYDGTNDHGGVQTAALQAAFNGAKGTLLGWGKVYNAGVWTDSADRQIFRTWDTTDYQEIVFIRKTLTNNKMEWNYTAGGVAEPIVVGGHTSTDWICYALTWDATADEVKAFEAGTQVGTTQAGLGTWAGNITDARIGAVSAAPAEPWYGWIGPVLLANVAWTPDQIRLASLAPGTCWHLYLDGINDDVNCGSDASLDDLGSGKQFTIDGWFKADAQDRVIVVKGHAGAGWGIYLASGKVWFVCYLATNALCTNTTSVDDSQWHHFAAHYDDATKMARVAIDGKWGAGHTGVGAWVSDAARNLYMGRSNAGTFWWEGGIGWARVSDNDRYSAGTDFVPPGRTTPPDVDANTVELWKINEGTDSTAKAEVNSPANDGTITGATWQRG